MAATLSEPLRNLLLASQLGLSVHHPLAGWSVLTILYRDAGSSSEPIKARIRHAVSNSSCMAELFHYKKGDHSCHVP